MAYRTERGATNFSRALRYRIGGGENLIRLLVEHLVVVAKVWPGDMPMKVLRLEIEREHVRKQHSKNSGQLSCRSSSEVGMGPQLHDLSPFSIISAPAPFSNVDKLAVS